MGEPIKNYACDVTIPVPAYVEKFLTKKFGSTHRVSKNSSLGILIIEICTKRYIKPENYSKKGEGAFTLQLPEKYFKKKAYQISKRKLTFLSNLLLKLFNEDMIETVKRDVQTSKAPNGKASLVDFLAYYDITESELKFETAYMLYRRKKDSTY